MIGIFFRPDKTQIMWAKVKGDKKLLVKDTIEAESCLKVFKECQTGENKIPELFQELKKEFKLGSEDVYLVMPDEMFEMTDTANITSDAELKRFVEENTGFNFEELYVSTAIQAIPGTYKKKNSVRNAKKFGRRNSEGGGQAEYTSCIDRGGKYGNGARTGRLETRKNFVAGDRKQRRHNIVLTAWRNLQT